MSTRQTLGALLTEQGRYARAVQVYEEDLALFPGNPWALAGLKRCFAATSDERLNRTEAALARALQTADVPIDVSCACARGATRGAASRARDWLVPALLAVAVVTVASIAGRRRVG